MDKAFRLEKSESLTASHSLKSKVRVHTSSNNSFSRVSTSIIGELQQQSYVGEEKVVKVTVNKRKQSLSARAHRARATCQLHEGIVVHSAAACIFTL